MKLPRFTKPYRLKDYKFTLVISVLALSILGVLVVGSANESYQNKQIVGLVLGLAVMAVVSLIDYVWVLNMYWLIYGFSILSLLLVLFIGDEVNGATRWIDLGFTTFQPSELAKILLILFFAKFLMKHEEDINYRWTIIKYAALAGVPLALIIVEPNLSTTICTALVLCLLIYIGGLSYKFIGTALLILIPTAIIFLSIVVQPDQKILKDYQQERILAFLEPEKYASDGAYQQNNSEMAIGSGQLTGKGLNNNTTTSVKNGNFILEPQTDFIFAIVGEELGFIGSCVVIALILIIVIQCILIGVRSQDMAGKIICCGIGGLIGFQSFINIGVATKVLPNTGVPLPFVSYGLTSLVSLYIGIGFVLNVGLQPKKYQ
ncbi:MULTISPECIES: FtsW/RodA/SpoVE family cell cycle protein [Extibacter]|uniref:FtsW/RodA/SpoVE family cell cycle protein n=1 Tax=Extibacter TaxID=1918452 RepID=UPI001AA0DC75|nr:FtsW/RodA/SpoVE family cell cycle protein [Extibacter muris]MBO1721657.1 rod shape-determining protein RodA [Extibacter sp. GGCC_0201]BDF33941.1 rod shape-determining protein RodA [Lachnospiraceae bacterium]MCB6200189.1 rod shape-determining protein RodA [Extibacter muris]MCQ4663042.1 rod shape-determining protein RodA [Extibacter muris]MCQ4692289.1 rod shape-determining protein RodA [Extibacter muris]